MKCSHPKAVEMKNLHWDISRSHAFEEGIDRGLVVIGGETCAKPKTIAPTGDFARFACQNRVLVQDFLGSWAVDDVPTSISLRFYTCYLDIQPFQPLPLNTRLDSATSLASDLEFNFVWCIDEYPISS